MSTLRQDEPGGKRITGVGVLDRSVALLDLLGDGPRTLRWLSGASGLPRPTAYRLLVALETHRLVARDSSGAFRLGPRLTELAVRADPALDLAALAGPVLAWLHEATGESVQLYVRSGDHRLCVAARDAGTGLRDSVPVGAVLPLDAGSGGKVLLAWSTNPADLPASRTPDRAAPDREAADREAGRAADQTAGAAAGRRAGRTAEPGADQAAGLAADRRAELAAVRKRGWAATVAEREPGVASVSAPVLADGELLGAVCVSGPASRLGAAPGKRLAPQVMEAAAELARLARPSVVTAAPPAT
jgi:DNA-binding IclR family transcriptional regulator